MKKILRLGGVLFLLLMIMGVGSVSAAAKYPTGDISWIIPYGPGGGYDLYSRAISAQLPKYLPKKVNVVVKNIRGGGGLTGVAQVYKSRPDGYTIGISYLPSPFVTQTIQGVEKVGYDFTKMTFLAAIVTQDQGIYVGAKTPYHTLKDLQKAEKVRFGTTAIGAKTWLDTIMVGKLFEINVIPVPGYKRSTEIKLAIQRGDVAASIHDPPLLHSEIKEGVLRPILFLGSERDPLWPDVPTAKEVGVPGIIPLQRMVRLILAPPGLPKDVEGVLSSALWKALHDKDFLAWAEKAKYPVSPMTSEEVKKSMLEVSENFEPYMDYVKSQLGK
ncbi:MAG: tripartite tricarboxylate transporter substrate binding protein [Deltaproteobacteria bacterium]|nr:MAG: tripartite tricarboxylate transporter substrate binding protein [Deltaproteobacteria bacterium]